MKTISSALQAFLLGNTTFNRADLISITLPNGQVLAVVFGTNTDITYSGTTYYASKLGAWERGPYSNDATFKINAKSMALSALIAESVLYPGTSTPLMQVVNQGMLNAAVVTIQTIFWPLGNLYNQTFTLPANTNVGWAGGTTSGVAMGSMQLMSGQIGNVRPAARSKITCEVYDLIYLLNRPMPPHSIQSACRHSVFDFGCTLLAANFTSTNVPLGAASTNLYLNLNVPLRLNSTPYVFGNMIIVSGVLYMCTTAGTSGGGAPTFNATRGAVTADGATLKWTSQNLAYPLGYVTFASGQNAGLKASVKTQVLASGVVQLQLLRPLTFPVAPGDNVTLTPGCAKDIPTCTNAFNNLIHFGGDPFVPNPELAQ